MLSLAMQVAPEAVKEVQASINEIKDLFEQMLP
jgi:hypothetical protein